MIFRGKHVSVSDQFRGYASDKIGKLARYLPAANHAIVDLRREAKGSSGRYVVQVTLNANGTFLRAEERNAELEAAVDAAVEALSQQVKRFKEKKLYRSERRVGKEERLPAAEAEEEEEALPPDAEVVSGRVVRVKQFAMKPMTEAEAIEQMELLAHTFFLFRDEDRGTLALLYRRRDGDYGMIVPQGP
ncbi:MAG TPA: ribosome-associated translation inhibitor RaiA [Dehalococcoidia bacterium]|nr:ribosome-associated translation inhibitor RaiA [Dehalococcoidia bacterium]